MNIYQILEEAAIQWPDQAALVDEEGSLSYRELLGYVQGFRDRFQEQGLGPYHRLGVLAPNGREFIGAMFGGMACGAVVLPVSHQLKEAEVDQIVRDAELHVLWRWDGSAMEWLREEGGEPFPGGLNAAFIRFTSGTTGKSKGVVISHESLLERTEAAARALELQAGDVVVWVLPMAYHFLVSIVTYLRFGVTIALCKDLLAQNIIRCAREHRGTLLYAAPMHYRMLASDRSGLDMPELKWAISTSSAIPDAVVKAFMERFGIPLTQAYGIIEIGLPMINHTLDDESLRGSVGRAAPGFDVEILDESFRVLPVGEEGQLAIRGPGMFDAYLLPWRSRKEVLQDGWFLTGDIATRNEEGYVTVCGRSKSMINVSGNKAFPEEVEAVLLQHPAVAKARVFGAPHPLMQEIVCAEVVLQAELNVEEVLRFCRQRLSPYKVPQKLSTVTAIEETDSGKIRR